MKFRNKIKIVLLFYLSCLVSLTSAIAVDEDPEINNMINHILRIHGPIFLATSEDFSPNKIEYLAVDINGEVYNIEGNPVRLMLGGIENFYGEFVPAKTVFPKSDYRFVGHVNLPVNAGRIIIKVGDIEKSYKMQDASSVITDIITFNNSIYEIHIEFFQTMRSDVLFKNDLVKARASTYFIGIQEIKWISYTPERAEELRLLEAEAQIAKAALAKTSAEKVVKDAPKLSIIKAQLKIAEEVQKIAQFAGTSADAQNFLTRALNAANLAKKTASEIPGNLEAEEAVRKAEEAANKTQAVLQVLKAREIAKTVQAVRVQQKIAEDLLKSATTEKTLAKAQAFATQAQNAAKEAKKLASQVVGNREAEEAANKAEDAAKKAQEAVEILKTKESAEKKAAETTQKVEAIKREQKLAEDAQKGAAAAKTIVAAQQFVAKAQNAVKEAKRVILQIVGNKEAEESVKMAEEAVKKAEEAVEVFKAKESAVKTANKVEAIKREQKLAEDAQKGAETAKTIVAAQQFVTKAQNAVKEATKVALQVIESKEAEEALKKTEDAAKRAQDALQQLKDIQTAKAKK